MPTQKHSLLLLLLLLWPAATLAPNSNCLANCNACDPNELALCKGPTPCHWGHHDPHNNATCLPLPSLSLIAWELGERTDHSVRKVQGSWGKEAKLSTCEYAGKTGKRTVDILGLYSGVAMLERTFPVQPGSDLLQLSFNLMREEWLPFNDFLMVDVSSGGNVLESLEISFETRIKVETQPTSIICSGKKVLSQKYSIKIDNAGRVNNQLTVVFTSFLYSANWGLTNVQLLQGCSGFSMFDQRSLSCTVCDTDSYLVDLPNGSLWCQKCPLYCLTCTSSETCLTCVNGTVLDRGLCQLPSRFKTQLIPLSESATQCGKKMVMVGTWGTPVVLGPIKNENDELYDEIEISFDLYYNPKDWIDASADKVKVKLNKGDIFTLSARNLTNKGIDSCPALRGNKTAVVTIFSKTIIHNDNVANLQFEFVGKNKAIEFAVSDLRIKSLKKAIFKQTPNATQTTQPASIAPNVTNNTVQISATPVSLASIPPSASPVIDKPVANQVAKPSLSAPITKEAEPAIAPSVAVINNVKLNDSSTNSQPAQITSPKIDANSLNTQPNQQQFVDNSTQIKVPASNSPTPVKDSPSLSTNNQVSPTNTPELSIPTAAASINVPQVNPYLTSVAQSTPAMTQTVASPIEQPSKVSTLKKEDANPTDINQNTNKPLAESIAYKAISHSSSAFLQIYLQNVQKTYSSFSVTIDKLPTDKYEISSFQYVGKNVQITLSISSSFTNGLLAVFGSNPGRILQTSQAEPIATVSIARYDAYSPNELSSMTTFSHILTGFAWVGMVLMFICVLLGQGVIAEQYVLALQTLFLHVYIAVDCPLSFSEVMSGLGILQNLDFMGKTVVRFSLWRDISFTAEFYPIIAVNCFYLVWFGCVLLAKKYVLQRNLIDEEKSVLHRLVDLATCRLINFSDQIWRYQFLPTLWLCLLQLNNSSGTFDTILCIASLVCTIAWPSFVFLHSRQQYYENEYSEYLYKFQDMYYRRIPQYQLPTNHHRVGYPLLRIVKTAVLVVLAVFLPSSWFSILIMILLQVGEIAYARLNDIYIDQQYFRFKFFQNSLLITIQLTLLCLACLHSYLNSSTYVAMGFLLSGFAFLSILNAFLRVGYLGHKKYLQIFGIEFEEVPDLDKKKLQTEQ